MHKNQYVEWLFTLKVTSGDPDFLIPYQFMEDSINKVVLPWVRKNNFSIGGGGFFDFCEQWSSTIAICVNDKKHLITEENIQEITTLVEKYFLDENYQVKIIPKATNEPV